MEADCQASEAVSDYRISNHHRANSPDDFPRNEQTQSIRSAANFAAPSIFASQIFKFFLARSIARLLDGYESGALNHLSSRANNRQPTALLINERESRPPDHRFDF
jgi:hypothetical protein